MTGYALVDNALLAGTIVIICIGLLVTCAKYNEGYYATAQECIKQGMEWQAGGPFGSVCLKTANPKKVPQ